MGITILVQDEWGKPLDSLGDPSNILHRVLPPPEDSTFHHVGMIDWYGDTTFNYLQAPRLSEELLRLMATVSVAAEVALLRKIDAMAQRVAHDRHIYLKFEGD